MCPVTLPVGLAIAATAISLAATVASTVLQQQQMAKQAAAQEKAAKNKQQHEEQQLRARQTEERMKAAQAIEGARVKEAALKGVANAKGLSNRSVAALRREAGRQGDRAVTTAFTNFEFASRAAEGAITGTHLTLGSALASIERPDWVGAGLKIGAATVNAGTDAYNLYDADPIR